MGFLHAFTVGILMPMLLGASILYLLRRYLSLSLSGHLAYGFLLGNGVICIVGTALLMNQIPFSLPVVRILGSVSLGFGVLFLIREWSRVRSFMPTFNFCYFITLLICLFSIVYGAYWPVLDWDAIALYDFRGRIFAEGLVIEDLQQFITDEGYFKYYYAYPLMTSVLHAWSYLWGLSTPMIIYGGFYTALVLIIWDELVERKLTKSIMQILPAVVASTPLLFSHASIAYTNLPYTAYYLAAVALAWRGIGMKNSALLGISAVMTISSILTRLNEPFFLAVLVPVVLYSLWYRMWIIGILYAGTVLLIRQLWTNYAVFDDALSPTALPEILRKFNLPFFIEVEKFLLENYIKAVKIPVFVAGGITVLGLLTKFKPPIYWLIFWVVNLGLLTIGGYFLANRFSFWQDIGGSAERMMIAFIPIFYLWSLEVWQYVYTKE